METVKEVIQEFKKQNPKAKVLFFIAPDFNLEYQSCTIQSIGGAEGVVGVYIGTKEIERFGTELRTTKLDLLRATEAEGSKAGVPTMLEEITEYLTNDATAEDVQRVYEACK